jgi:translation initiation factor 3 subunit D
VGHEWQVIEELDLAQFTKLQANKPAEEDLKWCGNLNEYDEAYDSLNTKNAKPLHRAVDKEFYHVTTLDDPVIEELATEGAGNVYATDTILAHLIASPRSVLPWDLVVQKMGENVFFDKRDDSRFDYLTVSETAGDPPADSEDPDSINSPDSLSLEASTINQNFSQQILRPGKGEEMELPNPFHDADGGMLPAAVAYRYRKFTLGNIQLIARCELHGTVVKKGVKQYMTAFALNEWDSNFSGGIEWRQKIDNQKGAVLATELKNNSNKLAKWTAQSVIAGADQMKIGFVSRKTRKDPQNHVVLATQFYKPHEFASQITLAVPNMWGIIKMYADKFMGLGNGKYVLMKDPNKPVVRIYSVPQWTFEEEEDDDEDEAGGAEGDEAE